MAGKTLVLKLDIADDKVKRKVMKTVSSISGIDSIKVEPNKLTVVCGQADPVKVVTKLRKHCFADVVSIGAAKEEKKEAPKKEDDKKKGDDKKMPPLLAYPYQTQYPYPTTHYYRTPVHYGVEEDPNACIIS